MRAARLLYGRRGRQDIVSVLLAQGEAAYGDPRVTGPVGPCMSGALTGAVQIPRIIERRGCGAVSSAGAAWLPAGGGIRRGFAVSFGEGLLGGNAR